MSTEIFDREEIQGIIHSNCLEAETGAGTVVLSPQKSGKSHLLEYIYRHRDLQQNTLYCWIGVDTLAAKVRPNEKLSDEVFLRYFLKLLHDEFCDYLAQERDPEERRRAELERDEARLGGEIHEDDLRKLLEANIAAVKGYLSELDLLRKYRDRIASVIAPGGTQDPFELYESLDDVLGKLKRMNKRVVIFIDDVHKIVGNHEFTETLLSLLRGASSDGKLVPLLSTPVHLMHPSLHMRARGDQTRSLFNDVKPEVLNSFTDKEALSFLNWPKPTDRALTDDEQKYILNLAGGSPHFLKEVRDRFLRAHPDSDDDRSKFELEAGQALAAAFETVWSRCTPEQRAAVRTAQAAKAHAPDVDLGPAACFARSQGSAFAHLFETFLAGKKDDEPDFLIATAAPAFRIFPTALCLADPESLRPLVTITVTNPTRRNARVRLECELQQFSLIRPRTIDVPAGETVNVEMQVMLKRGATVDLTNPEATQIRWMAEADSGSGTRLISEDSIFVRTLAVDQFVFASRDEIQNKLLDYSWLIAAWVNTQGESVAELANKAAAELRKQGSVASGYPGNTGPGAEEAVTAQVRELYNALKGYGITYQNRTGAPFTDRASFSQRVRLPSRSLKEHSANCLDGAVLFASLLAAADLDPLILFLHDHSLVGWKTARSPAAEMRFLEITDLMEKDFAGAHENGTSRYERMKHLVNEESKVDIADISNFAILVDVRAAWAKRNMGTLPSNV